MNFHQYGVIKFFDLPSRKLVREELKGNQNLIYRGFVQDIPSLFAPRILMFLPQQFSDDVGCMNLQVLSPELTIRVHVNACEEIV